MPTGFDALPKLLDRMIERIDLPRAVLGGRYLRAVATMEHNGTPIDVDTLGRLREHWPTIPEKLIERVDPAEACGRSVFRTDIQGRPMGELPSEE